MTFSTMPTQATAATMSNMTSARPTLPAAFSGGGVAFSGAFQAVHELSLTLRPGTITGLIGLGVLFGAPVVEAPVIAAPVVVDTPPPPAPATQTCPDGSVILATDVCPAPPPPPPPPAPAPERG